MIIFYTDCFELCTNILQVLDKILLVQAMYRRRCYAIRSTSACDVTIIHATARMLHSENATRRQCGGGGFYGSRRYVRTPGTTRVLPRGVGITQQQHPAAGPIGPIGGRRGRGQRQTREPGVVHTAPPRRRPARSRSFTRRPPAAVARWPAALEYG